MQNHHNLSEPNRAHQAKAEDEAAEQGRAARHSAALDYAEQGIPVFPCEAGGKRPLIRDWPNRATTDASRITGWFNRWPHANIAIVTGERSGILVLDVDDP